jgi:hypothetical protein
LLPQLFLFAAAGRLAGDIPRRAARGVVAGVLAVAMLVVHFDFCRNMGLNDRPGARGVAEYLRQNRAPSQPVIVDSSLLFLPVRYYVRDCWLLESDSTIPFYLGSPQLIQSDFLSMTELNALRTRKAWLVTHGDGSFVKPAHWRELVAGLSSWNRSTAASSSSSFAFSIMHRRAGAPNELPGRRVRRPISA